MHDHLHLQQDSDSLPAQARQSLRVNNKEFTPTPNVRNPAMLEEAEAFSKHMTGFKRSLRTYQVEIAGMVLELREPPHRYVLGSVQPQVSSEPPQGSGVCLKSVSQFLMLIFYLTHGIVLRLLVQGLQYSLASVQFSLPGSCLSSQTPATKFKVLLQTHPPRALPPVSCSVLDSCAVSVLMMSSQCQSMLWLS